MKKCNHCQQQAEFSFVAVISTVGVTPRVQQTSKAVLFCEDCMRELSDAECWGTQALHKAVNNAFTRIEERSVRCTDDDDIPF